MVPASLTPEHLNFINGYSGESVVSLAKRLRDGSAEAVIDDETALHGETVMIVSGGKTSLKHPSTPPYPSRRQNVDAGQHLLNERQSTVGKVTKTVVSQVPEEWMVLTLVQSSGLRTQVDFLIGYTRHTKSKLPPAPSA